MNFSKKQIEDWKKEHGNIYMIFSEGGKTAIVSDPTQRVDVMKMAIAAIRKSGSLGRGYAIAEVVLNNCWVAGDECVKTDPARIEGCGKQIDDLVDIPEYEMVKSDGRATVSAGGKTVVLRYAERTDVKKAESLNPQGKPLETEAHLLGMVALEGLEEAKQDKRAYLGLLLAVEELKNQKYTDIKKL